MSNFINQNLLTEEIHQNWLEENVFSGKAHQFIIVEKFSNRDIGSVYLKDIDLLHQKAEFGIFIGEAEFLGKGLGTEATKMIIEYGFDSLHLNKIYLRVISENIQAINSYIHAGFHLEGILQKDVFSNGKYNDIILMAKLSKERPYQ